MLDFFRQTKSRHGRESDNGSAVIAGSTGSGNAQGTGSMSARDPTPSNAGNTAKNRRHVEAIFHPQLRRTKEVIRRPEWVRRTGEAVAHRGSLNTMALFGIIFSNCVGGGYGFEDGIGAAGPLITLIVCIILPWLWAFPTGLAVAELSTAVPSNSGVLMWTNAAFPPFISFMCILATIFITFIGNATYPNLTAEYAQQLGNLSAGPVAGVKVGVVVLCCVLNCIGVEIVGSSSILLCVITILPFSLLTVIQLFAHGFNKAVLYVDVKKVDWAGFFSIISWNYANIENAGAVVEEVANPRRALPKAMMMLMISTYVAYVMPMLAGVSAMGVDQNYSQWKAGHWPEVAKVIAGDWLKYMLFGGALLSGVGFTLTSMCCTSRLLAGMGTMQMFPRKVSRIVGYYHPRLGTPIPAVVLNSVVTLVFSLSMDFTQVVALCQSIYCIRMLLIYAALVKLRIEYPNLPRPYALPCGTWMAALCLLPAAAFSLMASIVSAMTSLAIGMALVGFVVVGSGLSWLYCRVFAKKGFQGVIVQCEVTSDDEAAGNGEGEGGAEDGTLSEGVFYHDEDESSGDDRGGRRRQFGGGSAGDLLLGILPTAAAAVPPAATVVGTTQSYLRQRGATDLDAPGPAEQEMQEAEYTADEATAVAAAPGEIIVELNSGSIPPPTSQTASFPAFGNSLSREPGMRHRRRTHSRGLQPRTVGISDGDSPSEADLSNERSTPSLEASAGPGPSGDYPSAWRGGGAAGVAMGDGLRGTTPPSQGKSREMTPPSGGRSPVVRGVARSTGTKSPHED